MTVKEIQRALQRRFHNHKYDLQNSYIFQHGWECDFFSMTKTGYCYEVEIKLSRGDFFADFKKEKHFLFKKIASGAKYYFKNNGHSSWHGSIIGISKIIKFKRRHYWQLDDEYTEHADFINHYKDWYLEEREQMMHAPCTRIEFIDLNKVHCPHRFYYAVPEGLIKSDEVPVYAGLIYIKDSEAIIIKEAPFIHKKGQDLSRILMDKFYYERNELRSTVYSLKSRYEQ